MTAKYRWSTLTKLQIGRYAEYFAKMQFTLLGCDVYTSEVDERAIDFVVRQKVDDQHAHYWDVQVKSARVPDNDYVFFPKEKFCIRPNLWAVIVVFEEQREPELFLIPSTSWQQPNRDLAMLLVDRSYLGRKSKPEYGVKLSKKNVRVLQQFRLDSSTFPAIEQPTGMDVSLHIPEKLAHRLKAAGADLSRRALEALALDEYVLGHLAAAELRQLLGFATQRELEAFLTARGVRNSGKGGSEKMERARAAQDAAQAIRQMSRGVRLGGLKLKDLIAEGRL